MADLFIPDLVDHMREIACLQSAGTTVELVVEKEVKSLSSQLATLGKLLDDAEKRRLTEVHVRMWLENIKGIIYELEDWLDEWNINVHKPKDLDEVVGNLRRRTPSHLKKVRSFIPSRWSFSLKDDSVPNQFALEIKKFNDRLKVALQDAAGFDLVTINSRRKYSERTHALVSRLLSPHPLPRPITHSLSDELKVYGRESDKACLLNHLLPEGGSSSIKEVENNGIKVISIIGIGGSGKTAIAQMLYQDPGVEKDFELRRWVFVSNQFDLTRIAKDLLIGFTDLDQSSGGMFQLVEKSFSGKKFLIVLDDVWTDDYSKWKPLMDSLHHGAPGSIILMTTRNERVARAMGTVYMHRLGLISSSVCWLILKEMACSGRPEFCQRVAKVGRKIAKKCYGLPLAARIMGGLLRFKTSVLEWQQVLESDMWQRKELVHDLYPQLYMSYNELSPELKRCFSYCAIFPKGTDINVEQLIRLWMAEGFLGPSSQRGDKIMEIKGLHHFNNLVMRDFFHNIVKGSAHKNKIASCKMPDIVHDFAQFTADDVARHDVVHDFSQLTADDIIRHGKTETIGSGILDNKKLRSFIIFSHSQVPQNLFRCLTYVRALVLSCCHLEELPGEVGNLIYLRHLDLSGNLLKQLPETICDLYYLEFLDVHFCYLLVCLPERIGDLQHLRHLRINNTTEELQEMPRGFEKLTSIRTLDVFWVGGRYKNIEKLENLNDLEEIRIVIHGIVDFRDAKLDEKSSMENLELCFVGEGRDAKNVSLIKKFQPPPYLQLLKFDNYPGSQLPKWILAESLITNLRRLTLRSALSIISLPALGKLSSLEFLWLYYLPNLKRLGGEFFGLPQTRCFARENQRKWNDLSEDDDEISDLSDDEEGISDPSADGEKINAQAQVHGAFPSLKTLRIEYLENWETWEDLNEDDQKNNSTSVMPYLEELIIDSCPKLKALPQCIVERCHHSNRYRSSAAASCSNTLTEDYDWMKMSPFPSLQLQWLPGLKAM